MSGGVRALAAALPALGSYASSILPRVEAEREGWLARAAAIPDPVLREHALAALREKSANVDATGVFAVLAPRRHRVRMVRAGTSLQIAVDYLDSLGEDPGGEVLADGLQLHRALAAAVIPGTLPDDPYREHPRGDDGGYLAELVTTCAAASSALPSFEICREALLAAVVRCGEGQAYTHATTAGDSSGLRAWAEGLEVGAGFSWWETAAGAASSVSAHALLALAAGPRSTAVEAERVDAAYFPPIGALTVLLDDLVDLEDDLAAGEHNYLSYYADDEALADRLGSIAAKASAAVAGLPRAGRHEAILAGVAGFYLAQPAAAAPRWAPARRQLLESLGPATRVLAAFSRRRKRSGGAV
jgi:tetraprenyl-beta-curcumene synthase